MYFSYKFKLLDSMGQRVAIILLIVHSQDTSKLLYYMYGTGFISF